MCVFHMNCRISMWSWKSSLHFYLIPLNDTLELGRLRGMPFSRLECPPCPLESVPVPSLRVHTFSGGIISGAALVNADSSTIFSHRLILDYVWQASGDRSMSAFPLCHRFLIESMPTSPPPPPCASGAPKTSRFLSRPRLHS